MNTGIDRRWERERRAKQHGAFNLEKNKEEAIMNFGEAIKALKLGKCVAQLHAKYAQSNLHP